MQRIISKQSNSQDQEEILRQLQLELAGHPKQLPSPNLYALKSTLKIIFPELEDFYLQYHPKLQLMAHYKGEVLAFQQLSIPLKHGLHS